MKLVDFGLSQFASLYGVVAVSKQYPSVSASELILYREGATLAPIRLDYSGGQTVYLWFNDPKERDLQFEAIISLINYHIDGGPAT